MGLEVKKIQYMKVVKFIVGGIFIISALGMFGQKEFLTGLISASLGLIILPPISENLKQKFKLWNSAGLRYISYIILLFLIGITSKEMNYKNANTMIPNDRVLKPKNSIVKNENSLTPVLVEKPEDNSEFWQRYSPEVKTRILQMIRDKDCNGLQAEFDIAYQNSEAQRRRTGKSNSELLSFIDDAMAEIDCYK